MIFLLKYWKYILIGALVGACAVLTWRVDNLSSKVTTLKNSLKIANETISQHEQNIIITEQANEKYQSNINKLNSDLKRLRSRPAKCIPITSPSAVHNGQDNGGGYAGVNGISDQWLYEYAGTAETYRIERNACKDFVNQTWDSKK